MRSAELHCLQLTQSSRLPQKQFMKKDTGRGCTFLLTLSFCWYCRLYFLYLQIFFLQSWYYRTFQARLSTPSPRASRALLHSWQTPCSHLAHFSMTGCCRDSCHSQPQTCPSPPYNLFVSQLNFSCILSHHLIRGRQPDRWFFFFLSPWCMCCFVLLTRGWGRLKQGLQLAWNLIPNSALLLCRLLSFSFFLRPCMYSVVKPSPYSGHLHWLVVFFSYCVC